MSTTIIPKNSVSALKKNTQILCCIKIVLLVVLILLLFLPGMFSITFNYSNHSSAATMETEIVPISFLEYSVSNSNRFESDMVFCEVDMAMVLAIILFSFLAIELIFSIVRATRPTFTQKGKWQLILPIIIFLLFITACICYNFDSNYGEKRCILESTWVDTNTGEKSTREIITTLAFLEEHGMRCFLSTDEQISSIRTYLSSINFDFLFFIVIALLVIILSIDFYTIFSNSSHKEHSGTNEVTQ